MRNSTRLATLTTMDLLGPVFNHLVLPPRLPGQQDEDVEGIERSILTRLVCACDVLSKSTDRFRDILSSLRHSLCICMNVNPGHLEKTSMVQEFSNIQHNDLLILHVAQQNAALLFRNESHNGTNAVIVEVFEASPSAADVLAAETALQWDFPGRAVEIPIDEFLKQSFRDSLATFLEKACVEPQTRFEAHTVKANTSVIETRDTTNPGLITQMLMPLLEAVGSSISVPRLRKRVRDDVNIQDAETPWRRLPFWLILRVATQRHLCLALGNEVGRACYKFLLCTLLAQLLEDSASQLAPELTMMLRSKLCRRLAKLEMNKTPVCVQLFESIGPMLKGIIEKVIENVESAWANFKQTIRRPIPRLPFHADDRDLHLSLPNSGPYLDYLLTSSHARRRDLTWQNAPPPVDSTIEQVTQFTDRYFRLARLEGDIERKLTLPSEADVDCEAHCLELAKSIVDLLAVVEDAYDCNPEQMSNLILNLFDLWVKMDQCAVRACSLLHKYAPVFKPELLDVLQLPKLSSMRRLQKIQRYLSSRYNDSEFAHKTILSEPGKDCFAVQYLEQSDYLRKLQEKIEKASDKSRENKESEWTRACNEYDRLSKNISNGTCVCSTHSDGSRNVKGCTKCWHKRCRKRMKIAIHEDFLPKDAIRRAALVFELEIPSFLESYRDATFKILCLGYPSKPDVSKSPEMVLRDYTPLQRFMKSDGKSISLASAKKSFAQTHYKGFRMKVELSEILLPLALDFGYYDTTSGVWLKDMCKQLTFEHLCGIHVRRGLEMSVLPRSDHPPSSVQGPSSYEIVSSQTKCPSDMTIHEFIAYQRLLSGRTSRWLTMLVELGASNLNFSAEDTMHIFSQLAIQAGPAGNEADLLRAAHVVFQDHSFCQRLADQIDNRLRITAANWREVHCMEMLITLSLRLLSLTSGQDRRSAERLLKTARESTMQWISQLRDEVRNAAEADIAKRAATYGFWAALLCRRTFAVFIESDANIDAEDLCSFVQASVALQENLVVDLTKLSSNLKNMLIRDMKMAYQIQPLLTSCLKSNPSSLGFAINKAWSDSGNSTGRTFSPWRFLSLPHERWVESIISTTIDGYRISQAVHYNFIEGHLLVDGKPLGRLPLDIRESENVRELFGNQHLLTFPSPLAGMDHVMATRISGNEIHFGLRGSKVVIQALGGDGLLEYVPSPVFVDKDSFDLPTDLVENCVHWLNLRTKRLEIRRKPCIWKTRPRDWILDIVSRKLQRRRVLLVDPHSKLCKSVSHVFRHFEDPQRLTIYQPLRGPLCVEMRHLELSFFVNKNGLLECRELHAEIDPDQDAGTLYGFESKIVLRDVINTDRRSIIAPLGQLTYVRHGMHVALRASGTNEYGRFGIDNVLGRLSCPPEPRLLYSKAQFHAFSSFIMPDPLTGRTGAEEAMHTLRSGYCQPWAPIVESSATILKAIESLSPRRDYYPRDKKRLQTVVWDKGLTMHIQQDGYETLVREIMAKSDRLQAFVGNSGEGGCFDPGTTTHLRSRGELCRLLYERNIYEPGIVPAGKDIIYEPRDRQANSAQAANVYRIVKLICKRPTRIYMGKDLAEILHGWSLIGGFCHNSDSEGVSGCLGDLIDGSISEQWGSLVNTCRLADAQDSYSLIFRLGLLSFGKKPDMDAIKLLAAFGCLPELKALEPPSSPSFVKFKLHASPTTELLLNYIAVDYPDFTSDHLALYQEEGKRLASFFMQQWPSHEPSVEDFESTVINARLALKRILPEWRRLHRNMGLSEYVIQVQQILDDHIDLIDLSGPQTWVDISVAFYPFSHRFIVPSLSKDLLAKPCGASNPNHQLPPDLRRNVCHTNNERNISRDTPRPMEVRELGKILESFAASPNFLRRQFGNDLKMSLAALENVSSRPLREVPQDVDTIRADIKRTRATLACELKRIQKAFSAGDDRFHWLHLGGLWPCTTPIAVLQQLQSSSGLQFGGGMRERLVSYGVMVTTLQRLLRIRHLQLREDHGKLLEEWRNIGHENWNPLVFPDWLLLEIDSDLLIRPEQIDVAHAIISPESKSNSVLQMNMGKGKTSCIVPMAMATLADRKQLSRLVVPKALLLQTAQTMQSRIGGLVGREIRHVPFSRRTSTTPKMRQLYAQHHLEIIHCCGVILTTPDHILSFKLSGLQRLAASKLDEAQEMVDLQSWLTTTCRDVLDESDFTLSVKTQLIYPSGVQTSVDGHPHRWLIAQILLSLVEDHLPHLQREFPRSIEVVRRSRGFPIIHFLQTDIEEVLQHKIMTDVCDGRIPFLRLADSSLPDAKQAIKQVLSELNLECGLIERVSSRFTDKTSAQKSILLLRGLLLSRILILCLKKRWNVQFGLHPGRHPIAVPFDAKGVPSELAEFGHPDVSIILTCLSFYHSGLSLSQFREGLQQVLTSDDPAAGYERWVSGSDNLPEALQHWNVINTDDQRQVEDLWRHLRLERNILDHYMNNFVFPIHAKQFGIKLQASAWDLPLFPNLGSEDESREAKTTGFSGTNDNKMMLPLNIKQDDLPSLQQTNAEVLTYLLQSRNRQYNIAAWQGKRLSEEGLLRRIAESRIRILIDAGAYILEMDNQTLVKAWLDIDLHAKGALYFGTDNRAWFRYRGGKEVPFLATPFSESLEECLVYIDEAHIRGTDLKLPQNACGALTLALGQTKDHTAQAAMRLRQLGTTQSLAFFAPPEVHQSILDVSRQRCGHEVEPPHIDSSHVVSWLLEQTCRANEHLQNLYLAQGADYCRRANSQWENANYLTDRNHRQAYLKTIQCPESQTLEELYGSITPGPNSITGVWSPKLKAFMEEIATRRGAASCSYSAHSSALEEVEQEREVQSQVEEVRQVQKPMHYSALKFCGLHAAISDFVMTGELVGGRGYEHAFAALARTMIGLKYEVCATNSRLFVSEEFMRTIKLMNDAPNDNFLRPVEWILWNPSNETGLILISEEVEILIPIIRTMRYSKVHLISYAAPVTKNMLHFSGLSYYVLPRLPDGYMAPVWLSIELGIFAGRLYVNYAECSSLAEYLHTSRGGTAVPRANSEPTETFIKNPADFLLEWLTLCRKGQDIMHTPMGYICQGRSLHSDHPFFVTQNASTREAVAISMGGITGCGEDIDEDDDTDLEEDWNYFSTADKN